jgi:hypothetical protein
MADAAITFDALEPLEVHPQFPPQVTFDDVLAVLDGMDNLGQLLLVQILGPERRVNAGLGQDDIGIGRPNAENVAQGNINALLTRYLNSNNSCHNLLALSLFVARIGADDTNDALAFDNFAVLAKFFD